MHNLLCDSLISVRLTDGNESRLSLPDLLVAMAKDEIADFSHLRAHQAPAWHVLLVQLATLALLRAGCERLGTASEWAAALRALTSGFDEDEPWQLVVDDWTRPAFLQPPCVDSRDQSEYKREYPTADSLDVLVCSKNHDQKAERMTRSSPEEWLYALTTLQTTEGFLGAGNYGVARMNGGFASRPIFRCAAATLRLGGQVFRDVSSLLLAQDRLNEQARITNGFDQHAKVHELLWLLPWNGSESLGLNTFHPLGVEVCRRVRLTPKDEAILGHSAGSKVSRLNAKDAKGVVADPWIPVDRMEAKAFTVTREGFSYRRMVKLMDLAEFARPLLAEPTAAERQSGLPLIIHAAALARGQGKTEGFHSRSVVLSPSAASMFANEKPVFSQRAARMVDLAAGASGNALRPALIQLMQGKAEPDRKKSSNGSLVDPWIRGFDKLVDGFFFVELSRSFEEEMSDEDADTTWSRRLKRAAVDIFKQAAEAAPRVDQRRILGEARAANMLRNLLNKYLPALHRVEEQTVYVFN